MAKKIYKKDRKTVYNNYLYSHLKASTYIKDKVTITFKNGKTKAISSLKELKKYNIDSSNINKKLKNISINDKVISTKYDNFTYQDIKEEAVNQRISLNQAAKKLGKDDATGLTLKQAKATAKALHELENYKDVAEEELTKRLRWSKIGSDKRINIHTARQALLNQASEIWKKNKDTWKDKKALSLYISQEIFGSP